MCNKKFENRLTNKTVVYKKIFFNGEFSIEK